MTSLRDALALPEWARVAVSAGPDPVVTTRLLGVEVLADLRDDVPERCQGLLLAVAARPAAEPWRLDVLLRRAAAAGAAAVLVSVDLGPGRATVQVARRLSLPVLTAPDPLRCAITLRVHLALPELAAARWVTATADACASAPAGVEPLVQRVGAALDREVWLLDAGGRHVTGHHPRGSGPGPADDLDTGRAGGSWLREPVADNAQLVPLAVPTDHPRGAYVVMRRADNDEVVAVRAALTVLATSVAGRLALDRLTAERDARHRMTLLAELEQGGGHLAPESPGRMLAQGWELGGHHIGIRIDVPSALDPVALRPEVLRAFADAGVETQVVEQGAGWAAWTTFGQAPSQGQLRAHAASVRRVQWLLRSHLPTVMGVGSLRAGPEGLTRSLGEAGDAARIAATRAASGHLVHVDRLGLGQLLLAWTRTDTFAPAASSLLAPLQGQPDLLETLATYLDAESSLAATAAVLGVHRNTVSTRIAKATHLLGVNLEDPDERLAVQLACRSVLSHR